MANFELMKMTDTELASLKNLIEVEQDERKRKKTTEAMQKIINALKDFKALSPVANIKIPYTCDCCGIVDQINLLEYLEDFTFSI